jgi:hypothetical protein
MKKLLLALLAIVPLKIFGQTTITPPQVVSVTNPPALSGPIVDAVQFISASSSNWFTVPYAIVSSDENKLGAGVAVGYKVNDFLAPVLRLDYFDGQVWMPSLSMQLQAPIKLFGRLTAIPFAFAGVATPLSGKGNNNGTAQSILGGGLAVRLDAFGSAWFWQHTDLVLDVESWSGFSGQQIRVGPLIKF